MAKQSFTAGQVLTAQQMSDLQTNDFNQTVSTKTADYTFVVGDRGTRVVANKASAIAFTIDDSIFSAGDTLGVHNINTGVLTLTAGAGVTINGADVLTVAQWQGGTLYFTSASSAIWFPTNKKAPVQIVNSQTGAVATGTTTIPFDDTIPQNTEGTEFLTVSITPQSATNVLSVEVILNYSYSILNTVTMALFQDATANALCASCEYGSTATGMINSGLKFYMVAGTTSATTFKVRAGGESAGTLTLNGFGGARKLGGVMISSITVQEWTP